MAQSVVMAHSPSAAQHERSDPETGRGYGPPRALKQNTELMRVSVSVRIKTGGTGACSSQFAFLRGGRLETYQAGAPHIPPQANG
jgi:hypothetical protein